MPTRFRFQDHANAWNSHNVDRVLSFYADDIEVVADAPQPIRGKARMREGIERTLRAFPDVNGDVSHVIENDRAAAGIVHITGTHTGPWAFPTGGSFPATNKKVDYPMACFLELDAEGKIKRETDIADMATVFRQLGVSPSDISRTETRETKPGSSQAV